jgi:hypothetical protein
MQSHAQALPAVTTKAYGIVRVCILSFAILHQHISCYAQHGMTWHEAMVCQLDKQEECMS